MTAVAHPPCRPWGKGGADTAQTRSGRLFDSAPVATVGVVRSRQAQFRRRRAAVVLSVAVLLGGAAATGVPGGVPLTTSGPAPTVRLQPVARTTYVVQPGDTLWRIARSLQPSGDVRPLVQELARHRGSAPLRGGERIELPAP